MPSATFKEWFRSPVRAQVRSECSRLVVVDEPVQAVAPIATAADPSNMPANTSVSQ